MNKNVLITLKKELRSIFRDKKTVLRMLLFPLIIPAMIMLYGTMYDSAEESESMSYTIGINYDITDGEKEILDSLNIDYIKYDTKDELDKEYESNNIAGYVTYNEKSNEYKIYTNSSNTNGMSLNVILSQYLESYSDYLTNAYLISHGIDLNEAYNHFEVDYEDLSNTNYMLNVVLTVSFTYIIMAICMATSSMATGVTATERENGTLETILTFPIKKTELLTGKYLSSVIVGFIASLVGFVLTVGSLLVGKHVYTMFEEFEFILSFESIFGSLIIIAGASFFIAGVAFALTCFSRTYKEAQSAVSLLNMVCIVPLFVSILELDLNASYYLIPICNFEQILMDLFTNTASLSNVLITIGSTIVYIGVVLFYIVRSYNSEKILFAK